MNNVSELDNAEQLQKKLPVIDIAVDDEYVGALQQCSPGMLQRCIVVVVEVVESHDAIAALPEGGGNVRTDEACGAGD